MVNSSSYSNPPAYHNVPEPIINAHNPESASLPAPGIIIERGICDRLINHDAPEPIICDKRLERGRMRMIGMDGLIEREATVEVPANFPLDY